MGEGGGNEEVETPSQVNARRAGKPSARIVLGSSCGSGCKCSAGRGLKGWGGVVFKVAVDVLVGPAYTRGGIGRSGGQTIWRAADGYARWNGGSSARVWWFGCGRSARAYVVLEGGGSKGIRPSFVGGGGWFVGIAGG